MNKQRNIIPYKGKEGDDVVQSSKIFLNTFLSCFVKQDEFLRS